MNNNTDGESVEVCLKLGRVEDAWKVKLKEEKYLHAESKWYYWCGSKAMLIGVWLLRTDADVAEWGHKSRKWKWSKSSFYAWNRKYERWMK